MEVQRVGFPFAEIRFVSAGAMTGHADGCAMHMDSGTHGG
jgi:hypothetical protein